jgi:hypothetical protein
MELHCPGKSSPNWLNYLILDPKFDELLRLPEQGYSAVVLCAVGYRAVDDQYASLPKVRYSPETVVGYYD